MADTFTMTYTFSNAEKVRLFSTYLHDVLTKQSDYTDSNIVLNFDGKGTVTIEMLDGCSFMTVSSVLDNLTSAFIYANGSKEEKVPDASASLYPQGNFVKIKEGYLSDACRSSCYRRLWQLVKQISESGADDSEIIRTLQGILEFLSKPLLVDLEVMIEFERLIAVALGLAVISNDSWDIDTLLEVENEVATSVGITPMITIKRRNTIIIDWVPEILSYTGERVSIVTPVNTGGACDAVKVLYFEYYRQLTKDKAGGV